MTYLKLKLSLAVAFVAILWWRVINVRDSLGIILESQRLVDDVERYYHDIDDSRQKLGSNQYNRPKYLAKDRVKIGKENATILMLTRNWELPEVLASMRSLEDRFNKDYKYPWTFLNDVPFTKEFIRATTAMASGETEYGLIDADTWNVPSFINETRMLETFDEAVEKKIIYGHSLSYRNMCRFNSGYFFRQPLTMKYDYYFRVEPDVEYMCDFQYDPFELMRVNDKKYGFVMTFYEYEDTIPTLWETVEAFMEEHPEYIHPNSAIDFITTHEIIGAEGKAPSSGYNLCHFWSNFEIGNLNFFRSEEYLAFFNHLEKTGGFYYERWGDAPVHSIAVSLLMNKSQIHYFDDIGYYHAPFMTCPTGEHTKISKRCVCRKDTDTMDMTPHSCLPRWWRHGGGKTFLNNIDYE